ncbi:hypothetical protein D9M70_628560 [compost metagenome]
MQGFDGPDHRALGIVEGRGREEQPLARRAELWEEGLDLDAAGDDGGTVHLPAIERLHGRFIDRVDDHVCEQGALLLVERFPAIPRPENLVALEACHALAGRVPVRHPVVLVDHQRRH